MLKENIYVIVASLKNTNDKITRTYSVMRYHDGKVENLDAKYLAEDLIENEPELFE